MSYSNMPKPLGEALSEVIQRLGIRQRLDEAEAVEGWREIAGPRINRVTRDVWIEHGRLYVQITSAAWRQELHFNRGAWLDRLNTHLERPLVKEIIFR